MDWIELEFENYNSRHCGQIYQPWSIITNTNIVTLKFRSDGNDDGTHPGFLAVWTATTEPPTYSTPTGCETCTFPFTFGDSVFDTCISLLDVYTQPWCPHSDPPNYLPPSNAGTHVFPPPKISCYDSDSSCPSSPPQTLITSPNYPGKYPNNANEVK